MMRPVWRLELSRTTNAPFDGVRRALLDSTHFATWHPRPSASLLDITEEGPSLIQVEQNVHRWGVEEHGIYRVEPFEGRLLLTYRAQFKGWPVLILMGYWRLRSHRIWERFVESL